MPLLNWSPFARKDVDDIYDYIGRRDRRPATADKVVAELSSTCESIAQAFAGGSVIGTARFDLGIAYRAFTHKRWVVIFRPIAGGIEVLRVLDGSRDYPRLFGR
ncbi:MAG TPA: type II toxin-antitoxin system RelE/ParE family toxin [Lacipirellulaceae bacterium]|jgi:plasmid stabilization system protein ParE